MSIKFTGRNAKTTSGQSAKTANFTWALLAILFAISSVGFTAGCAGNVNGQAPSVQQLSLQFSPSSLNFGNVVAGKKTSQNASVTNMGTSPAVISQIVSNNNQFTISGLTFPLTLAPSQTANFVVWFNGATPGKTAATITFQAPDTEGSAQVSASATAAAAQPQLVVSPAALDAGSATVGSKTSSTVTLSNAGTADLTISLITLSGAPFSVSGIATPLTISAGQSAAMTVVYAPTAAETDSGKISITSNDPASPASISLSGTGTSAPVGHLTLTPSTLAFGNVNVGSTTPLTSTVTNTGQGTVHISSVFASGTGFSVGTFATPATLAAGQSAQIQVNFAPTATGLAGGTVAITSDAPGVAPGLSLTGTGVQSGISVSPASLSFGSVLDGQTKSQTVTVTNTGTANLTISQLSSTGAGVSVSGVTAPLSIAAGQSSSFNVQFAPQAAGSTTGSVTLISNAPNSPATVLVTGAGVATTTTLSASPSAVAFGSVTVGNSANQSVIITNAGNSTSTITQIGVSGANVTASGISTPVALAPSQSITLNLQYSPAAAGSLNGSVSIVNAQGQTTSVVLSGSSIASTTTLSVSPAAIAFGSVNVGSSANQSVTITNTGNSSTSITQVGVSGANVTASGISTPLTLAPSQSATLNLQYSPAAATSLSGSVSIVNAQGQTTTVSLTGSGAQASLAANPGSVSFSNVVAGSTNSQSIQISNGGNTSLTITQANISGSGFSTTGLSLPLTLAAGQNSTFNVQFTTQSAGTVSGTLSLVSNAANSPSSLSLSASSVAAAKTLLISATSLSFGSVNAGSSATQLVSLTNTGNASVTVSQISISGTNFSLSGASVPVTLSAGQMDSFSVQYSPAGAETDSGSVTIVSNATGSPAAIALSGTGVAQQTQHSVQLSWTDSDSSIAGYNVYRTTTSGSGYVLVNGSLVGPDAFSDTTVQSGTTYYYVTTAVDSSGNESAYSNEAQAIIP
jgi:hypothetical protein